MTIPALAALAIFMSVLAPAATNAQVFEFKLISSYGNRPSVAIWNSPLRDILIGLHKGTSLPKLATELGLSPDALATHLATLRAEGIVAERGGSLSPTCMIVQRADGEAIESLAAHVAAQTMPFMRSATEAMRKRYREIAGFRQLDFDDVSFFLVSNVLLDNWQINDIERRWLRAERPLRGNARYYCAFLEKTDPQRESFGIFGNSAFTLNDNRVLGVYGNRRGSGADLISVPSSRLAAMIGEPGTTNRSRLLEGVVDQLQKWSAGGPDHSPPRGVVAGLEALGLVRQGRPLVPVLRSGDNMKLSELAQTVTEALVRALNAATPGLRSAWAKSRWARSIAFEEYSIWWYHFFYTVVTEQLGAEGLIRIPPSGLFHYALVLSDQANAAARTNSGIP